MKIFLMLTIVREIIEKLIKHNFGYQAEAGKSFGNGNNRCRCDDYAWLSFRRYNTAVDKTINRSLVNKHIHFARFRL